MFRSKIRKSGVQGPKIKKNEPRKFKESLYILLIPFKGGFSSSVHRMNQFFLELMSPQPGNTSIPSGGVSLGSTQSYSRWVHVYIQ